jgi:hypothetical protein
MKQLILSLFILAGITACSHSKDSTPIKKEDLVGEWKHTQSYSASASASASASKGAIEADEDKDKYEDNEYFVYKFTEDNQFTISVYDKKTNNKKYDVGPLEYKIDGSKITTVDVSEEGSSFSMPDYQVVSLTKNQLQLDLVNDEDSESPDLVLVLDRVNPEDKP